MSDLLVQSKTTAKDGKRIDINPTSAGWEHVGFQVYLLQEGDIIDQQTNDEEICVVVLSGRVSVNTTQEKFENIGKRMDVFEKIPPYSVYVPSKDDIKVEALTVAEVAFCKAPGKGNYRARLIPPEDVGVEDRGEGNTSRKIHNILPEEEAADSLLIVEVYTPEGNTSSYPPHKHDELNLPHESKLEETYYHKLNPDKGFVFQRVYTDDRSLDESMAVGHDNVVLVPKGYHPVSAISGYDSYYLNVMAGPKRTWKFHTDPQHEWLFNW
ncbi:5-deoxy-glucuronate isomerase [Thalassobacillus sp. CUG 92003]|uniref:5-deoxy-glucuronate isomerase n=1 Tax=Thalassobacillus sp. CUG 92003 TaxID=2736641 RepID=UPI0015E6F5BE|nr:5-deoxy-glucuronate isomerase [Thalassobacillus sp. CUG 92003]